MSTVRASNIERPGGGGPPNITRGQVVNVWLNAMCTTAPATVNNSMGLSSLTDVAIGAYTFNLGYAFTDINFHRQGSATGNSGLLATLVGMYQPSSNNSAFAVSWSIANSSNAAVDPYAAFINAMGALA